MKNGKILKSIIALTCCLTMGLGALTGCGGEPECEHVYTWTLTKQSTCSEHGINTGVCGLCGNIKEEQLPLDENKHVFTGEWDITNPTEEKDGLAVKTCVNNPAHKAEVVLPRLTATADGYDAKEYVTKPTSASKGEIKLTLNSIYGAITFNAELQPLKLDSLENIVVLASLSQGNVREVNGWMQETKDGTQQGFSYYFGDDYTYIYDGVNRKESWYSLDDNQNVFAMSKEIKDEGSSSATVDPDNKKEYLSGFHYNSTVNISSFYGAENGLAQLYEVAKNGSDTGVTIKYEEIPQEQITDSEHKWKDGSINGLRFSYGYDSGSWFARLTVTFSIFGDGTLKNLKVQTEAIRPYMYAREADGSAIYYKEGDASVEKHGAAVGDIVFGYEYPTDFKTGGVAYEYDKFGEKLYEQTNKATGNVVYFDGENYYDVIGGREEPIEVGGKIIINYITEKVKLDYVPELEDVYVKDKYGEIVYDSNGDPVKKYMAAGGYPATAHYSDDHPEVSYKTAYFEQTKKITQEDVDNGFADEADVVKPNPYPYDSLYIKDFDIISATAGGSSVDISSGLSFPATQVVNLKLGNISPSTASLSTDAIETIYVKDEVTGDLIRLSNVSFSNGSKYSIQAFFTSKEDTITLNSQYAGDVTFVFKTKSGKCSKEVQITFTKSQPTSLTPTAAVYTVIDGVANDLERVVNTTDKAVNLIVGQQLRFWAAAAPAEAAYASTDILPVADKDGLIFSQSSGENNYQEWLLKPEKTGEYIVTISYYDGTNAVSEVSAQFKVTVSEKLEPMELLSGKTFKGKVLMDDLKRELTAQFTTKGEIIITVANNNVVYTYGLNDEGEFVTAYKSGMEPTVTGYNFRFYVNDAGDLLISHGTGYGNESEDIVLTQYVEEQGQP